MESQQIKQGIKNYLIVIEAVIIALMLLFGKGCHQIDLSDKSNVTSYMKPDSIVYIPGTIDTVKIHDKQIVYKPFIVYRDSTYKTEGKDSLISKETNIYDDTVRSSEVLTHYKITTIGRIKSLNLDSKLINRKEIKRIDTVKVFHTETVITNIPPKWGIYSGINLYGNKTSFDVGPEIAVRYKNKMIDIGYNIINQQYKVGVKIVIWNSKH